MAQEQCALGVGATLPAPWPVLGSFIRCLFFLSACPSHGLQLLKVAGREGNLIAIFHEEHSRVLQQLQVFTFFPESLPAARKPFERKTVDRQSARKPLLGLVSGGLARAQVESGNSGGGGVRAVLAVTSSCL